MHLIPAKPTQIELIEKRSRFITFCEAVTNDIEFKNFLNRLKLKYADAGHFCYGFRIGPLKSAHRGFSDDGEPSGTAGMPILNVIEHSEYSDLAVIIVRYFGGTKLGTGGLARAYSQATKSVLNACQWNKYEAMETLELACEFSQENQIRYIISRLGGEITQLNYARKVHLKVKINQLADLSALSLYRLNRGDH